MCAISIAESWLFLGMMAELNIIAQEFRLAVSSMEQAGILVFSIALDRPNTHKNEAKVNLFTIIYALAPTVAVLGSARPGAKNICGAPTPCKNFLQIFLQFPVQTACTTKMFAVCLHTGHFMSTLYVKRCFDVASMFST